MKIIFIYTDHFAYKIGDSSGNGNLDKPMESRFEDVQTAFIHVESKDQEAENSKRM